MKEKIIKTTAHYTDLGLVINKEMFQKAMEGKNAILAYNFINMEQLRGIILGCLESRTVILQVSGSARR